MKIELGQEEEGRWWIAEVKDLPGTMVYGSSRNEAISKVEASALRVLADRLDNGKDIPGLRDLSPETLYKITFEKAAT